MANAQSKSRTTQAQQEKQKGKQMNRETKRGYQFRPAMMWYLRTTPNATGSYYGPQSNTKAKVK